MTQHPKTLNMPLVSEEDRISIRREGLWMTSSRKSRAVYMFGNEISGCSILESELEVSYGAEASVGW